jgi:hypothetical protein
MGDHGHLQFPVVVYAVNLLVLTMLLFSHLRHLAANAHLAAPDLTREAVTHIRRQILMFGVVPAASIAASFYSPRLGMYLYVLLALPAFVSGGIDRMTRATTGGNDHHHPDLQ